MKYTQLDRSKKEALKIIIYGLREQGLSYLEISKELKKQSIKISPETVRTICKDIFALKGEIEPKTERVKSNKANKKIDESQELNKKIYELRENGLSYREIVKELKLQGIKLSVETVRKRCKELYEIKGKTEPELRKKDIYNEQIYILRQQGLSYSAISEELEKQGIKINPESVRKICKEIYFFKGQTEPKVGKTKEKNDESQELNEIIYKLREKRLSYSQITKEIELHGITVDIMTVYRRCKKIYALKGKAEPKTERVKSNKSNKKNDESEEVNKKIYELREKGLSYRKIVEELDLQGIKLCMNTIRKRCKEVYRLKEKTEPKSIKKDIYNEQIYILKKQGLSYSAITEELEKQGIKISRCTVIAKCKKIFALKGEAIPQLKKGRPKSVVDENQEVNKKIYELMEKRFSYSEIVKELELQGIKLGSTAIYRRCKELYKLKGKTEPELIKTEVDKEQIYILREQGSSYRGIVEELEKQGIKISIESVRRICKEVYFFKGQTEPKVGKTKKIIDDKQEVNKKIYELRETGLSYSEIAKELEVQGIKISRECVRRRCKELYEIKGKTEPELRKREIDKEQIYILREQGLSYRGIVEELKKQGIKTSKTHVVAICKEVYTAKGKIEPKAVRNKKNENAPTEPIEKEEYKKINEQQLAKAILNLMTTRKATLEQVKIIADYYGVDIEKTMNSLEER